MDQNQTLGSVIRSGSQQGGKFIVGGTSDLRETALVIYTLTMNLKFPNITDLENIDFNTAHSVAEFSIASTRPFLDVWDELVNRQKNIGRQQRAA